MPKYEMDFKLIENRTYPVRFCRPTSDLVKFIPEINVFWGFADMYSHTEL